MFRTNEIYRQILEHFDFEEGLRFLEAIETKYSGLASNLQRYSIADRQGGAALHKFKNYGMFSSSTIRYLCHLGNILEYFPILTGMRIVEVGGGFGGLASLVCTHADVKSYTLVDLPDVMKLQARWLSETLRPEMRSKITFWNEGREEPEQFDLFISNFAFTECSPVIQDHYIETLIKRSDNGFILYNMRVESYHPAILLTKLQRAAVNVRRYQEEPLTCPTNMLIVFGNANRRSTGLPLPFPVQRAIYSVSPRALASLKTIKRAFR